MDYEMKLVVRIDNLAKKNQFRDSLITQLGNGITAGTVISYALDIKGIVNTEEDMESYKSPSTP